MAETHLSVITFIGDRAYKLKKRVRFPFVDLRARETREAICHHEVDLNRRLAPDVYLGVADVTAMVAGSRIGYTGRLHGSGFAFSALHPPRR